MMGAAHPVPEGAGHRGLAGGAVPRLHDPEPVEGRVGGGRAADAARGPGGRVARRPGRGVLRPARVRRRRDAAPRALPDRARPGRRRRAVPQLPRGRHRVRPRAARRPAARGGRCRGGHRRGRRRDHRRIRGHRDGRLRGGRGQAPGAVPVGVRHRLVVLHRRRRLARRCPRLHPRGERPGDGVQPRTATAAHRLRQDVRGLHPRLADPRQPRRDVASATRPRPTGSWTACSRSRATRPSRSSTTRPSSTRPSSAWPATSSRSRARRRSRARTGTSTSSR